MLSTTSNVRRLFYLFIATTFLFFLCDASLSQAQPPDEKTPVFSGPQEGERLAAFKARGVFDEQANKEVDLISQAGDKPVAIIFVHELTRPSVALTRLLMNYAATRAKDGLVSGVVFLADDATKMETTLKRARHALPEKTFIGISTDGQEGPGAYGLNRNVALTVLIGKKQRVTANFALVQPSVQADAEKIAAAIVEVLGGGEAPTLEDLGGGRYMAQPENLRPLLAPVIRKNAAPEEVDKAAAAVEKYIAKNPAARKQLGQIAQRVVNAKQFENYGTPKAREYIRKWAEKYGPQAKPKRE